MLHFEFLITTNRICIMQLIPLFPSRSLHDIFSRQDTDDDWLFLSHVQVSKSHRSEKAVSPTQWCICGDKHWVGLQEGPQVEPKAL